MSDKSPSIAHSPEGSPVTGSWSGDKAMGLLDEGVPLSKAARCEISDP